jgi:hypothetical protein
MILKEFNKPFLMAGRIVLTVVLLLHIFVITNEDLNSFNTIEEQLSNSAIVQTTTSTFQSERRSEIKNLLTDFSFRQEDSFIKIKLRSCSTQLNNELSFSQKSYTFLTSHFSTST